MKALWIKCGEAPQAIELDETPELETWQRLVGGRIEPFDGFIEGFRAYVNEEGLFSHEPNRAVYATKAMEEQGYLSQMDGKPVKEGDLYCILFGDFVVYAGSVDEEGITHVRGMTDEEIHQVSALKGISDANSGIRAAFRIAMGAGHGKGGAA